MVTLQSFSAWVIEYFKHMCDDGILNIGNTIHLECIWFVYADFLQSPLDEVVHEWNTHYIRSSRHDTVTGIPDVLFHVPSLGDYEIRKCLLMRLSYRVSSMKDIYFLKQRKL